jgi:hypothetical protein
LFIEEMRVLKVGFLSCLVERDGARKSRRVGLVKCRSYSPLKFTEEARLRFPFLRSQRKDKQNINQHQLGLPETDEETTSDRRNPSDQHSANTKGIPEKSDTDKDPIPITLNPIKFRFLIIIESV